MTDQTEQHKWEQKKRLTEVWANYQNLVEARSLHKSETNSLLKYVLDKKLYTDPSMGFTEARSFLADLVGWKNINNAYARAASVDMPTVSEEFSPSAVCAEFQEAWRRSEEGDDGVDSASAAVDTLLLEIYELSKEDGKLSAREMGEIIGVSRQTVSKRIREARVGVPNPKPAKGKKPARKLVKRR